MTIEPNQFGVVGHNSGDTMTHEQIAEADSWEAVALPSKIEAFVLRGQFKEIQPTASRTSERSQPAVISAAALRSSVRYIRENKKADVDVILVMIFGALSENKQWRSTISISRVAKLLNRSHDTVVRAIERLVKAGAISRTQRQGMSAVHALRYADMDFDRSSRAMVLIDVMAPRPDGRWQDVDSHDSDTSVMDMPHPPLSPAATGAEGDDHYPQSLSALYAEGDDHHPQSPSAPVAEGRPPKIDHPPHETLSPSAHGADQQDSTVVVVEGVRATVAHAIQKTATFDPVVTETFASWWGTSVLPREIEKLLVGQRKAFNGTDAEFEAFVLQLDAEFKAKHIHSPHTLIGRRVASHNQTARERAAKQAQVDDYDCTVGANGKIVVLNGFRADLAVVAGVEDGPGLDAIIARAGAKLKGTERGKDLKRALRGHVATVASYATASTPSLAFKPSRYHRINGSFCSVDITQDHILWLKGEVPEASDLNIRAAMDAVDGRFAGKPNLSVKPILADLRRTVREMASGVTEKVAEPAYSKAVEWMRLREQEDAERASKGQGDAS
jgi:hypothetical protein